MKTTGIIIPEPRVASLREMPLTEPGADDVVVDVGACGLCTWEQRVYRGVKPTYPFWGGHEVAGRVQHAGPGSGLAPGDLVALALMRRCGACYLCRSGRNNHCAYVHPTQDGSAVGPRGLSSSMVVPRYQVFRLATSVSVQQAALTEPIACCHRSIARAVPPVGGTALVIGAGTMGLVHTILLGLLGVRVAVVDDDPALLAAARAAGAEHVAELAEARTAAEILELTRNQGVDAVFCTRGDGRGIQLGVKVATRGGRIILYQSIREAPKVELDANDLHYREIVIAGTISQSLEDFERAAAILSAHPRAFDALITAAVGHERAQEAFDLALQKHSYRVLVTF